MRARDLSQQVFAERIDDIAIAQASAVSISIRTKSWGSSSLRRPFRSPASSQSGPIMTNMASQAATLLFQHLHEIETEANIVDVHEKLFARIRLQEPIR